MKTFRSPLTTGLAATVATCLAATLTTGLALATAPAATAAATTAATAATAAGAAVQTPLVVSAPASVVTGTGLRVTTYTRAAAPVTVILGQVGGLSARYQGVSDTVGRYVVTIPVKFNGHVSVVVAADAGHAGASRTISYRASGVVQVAMVGYYKTAGGAHYYHPPRSTRPAG